MTNCHAPAKVSVQTFVDGQAHEFVLEGDVAPADAIEAAIVADLHAAGVLKDAPAKPRKSDKPDEGEK